MTQSYVLAARTSHSIRGAACYVLLLLATLVAYIPTFIHLVQGPWQTEQEGHGPLIIAASLWLVWASRARLAKTEIVPAPVVGWAVKGAVAYAGTRAVGEAALRYFASLA